MPLRIRRQALNSTRFWCSPTRFLVPCPCLATPRDGRFFRSPQGPRSSGPVDAARRACVELSAFLEITAPGGGHDPPLLTEDDMLRFAADQATWRTPRCIGNDARDVAGHKRGRTSRTPSITAGKLDDLASWEAAPSTICRLVLSRCTCGMVSVLSCGASGTRDGRCWLLSR